MVVYTRNNLHFEFTRYHGVFLLEIGEDGFPSKFQDITVDVALEIISKGGFKQNPDDEFVARWKRRLDALLVYDLTKEEE